MQLKERFYLLDKISIMMNSSLKKERTPRDYKGMKAYLKALGIDLQPFDSQRKYREALAKFFGMDATKYANTS